MSVGYSRPNWARSSIIYLQIDSLQFKKHVPEILVVCVKRSSRATQSGSKCSITGNTTRLCVRRWEIIIVDRQKLTIFQEFSCAPLLQEHLHQRNVLLGTHQATTKVTKKNSYIYQGKRLYHAPSSMCISYFRIWRNMWEELHVHFNREEIGTQINVV